MTLYELAEVQARGAAFPVSCPQDPPRLQALKAGPWLLSPAVTALWESAEACLVSLFKDTTILAIEACDDPVQEPCPRVTSIRNF